MEHSNFKLTNDLLSIRKESAMTFEEVEIISGCKIAILEQLTPADDTLNGEKCAVKRWRVSVKTLITEEIATQQKLFEAEMAALKKKVLEVAMAKVADNTPPPPPPPPPKA